MRGRKQTSGRFATRKQLTAYVWQAFRRGVKCREIAKDCQIAPQTVNNLIADSVSNLTNPV